MSSMSSGMILAPILLVFVYAVIASKPRKGDAKRSTSRQMPDSHDEKPIPLDELSARIAKKNDPYN